jgi:hypothetical protein
VQYVGGLGLLSDSAVSARQSDSHEKAFCISNLHAPGAEKAGPFTLLILNRHNADPASGGALTYPGAAQR